MTLVTLTELHQNSKINREEAMLNLIIGLILIVIGLKFLAGVFGLIILIVGIVVAVSALFSGVR